eukprot:364973-Chlamydomonas_euryale.AAC.2
MSNQELAVAHVHPFTTHAPYTERSVSNASRPARTCHIVHCANSPVVIYELHANNAEETLRRSEPTCPPEPSLSTFRNRTRK